VGGEIEFGVPLPVPHAHTSSSRKMPRGEHPKARDLEHLLKVCRSLIEH
jgi:ribosomal protein L32